MTVSTSTSRIEYTGDAVTAAFSFPYYFLANGDLKVYLDGVLQTITTHYTVTGAANPAGGTVTFVTAPPSGDLVVIYREVALTQSVDYSPNDPFPANTHEQALDRLTMIAQQLDEEIGRALKLPSTSTYSDLTVPDPQAGYYLQWKDDLSGLQNVAAMSPTAYAVSPFVETLLNDANTAEFLTTLGIKALVILDTPELVVNGSTTTGSWQTPVASATLVSNNAKGVLLRVKTSSVLAAATSLLSRVYIRKTGSGLAVGNGLVVAECRQETAAATNFTILSSGEFTVNLNNNFQFDWQGNITASGTLTTYIYIVGYYL